MKNFEDSSKEELVETLTEVTVALHAFVAASKQVCMQLESPRGVTEVAKGTLKNVLDTVENDILPLVT